MSLELVKNKLFVRGDVGPKYFNFKSNQSLNHDSFCYIALHELLGNPCAVMISHQGDNKNINIWTMGTAVSLIST